METAIQKSENGQMAVAIPQAQMELIKRTIAKDATNDELQLFLYDCTRRGVHPLDKLLHFTKRSGKYTPITSIDFLRMKAESTGNYAGNDDPLFGYDEHGKLSVATVTVWKIVSGQRCGFTASARWSAYFPGDTQGFMWKKMPELMLGKCAEALALRKAFPGVLAGLYTTEEMDQAGQSDAPKQETAKKAEVAAEQEPETVHVRPEDVKTDTKKLRYEDEILPIGRSKGKRFRDISPDSLAGAVKWMQNNSPEKWTDPIAKITAYLQDTGMPF